MKKCDKCGEIFPASSFMTLCADGEYNYVNIKIYGEQYNLCPKCTYEIFTLINKKSD